MNIKRIDRNPKVKYVGPEEDQIVLYEGKILGFIHRNRKAKITACRDGRWLVGPRWELKTYNGKELRNIPADKLSAVRWLLAATKASMI